LIEPVRRCDCGEVGVGRETGIDRVCDVVDGMTDIRRGCDRGARRASPDSISRGYCKYYVVGPDGQIRFGKRERPVVVESLGIY